MDPHDGLRQEGAIRSTTSLGRPVGSTGMVSVRTISSTGAAARRSRAGPQSTPWVAAIRTLEAPWSRQIRAASAMLPPVEIMSSIRRTLRSFTSPMIAPTSMCSALTRRLSTMASSPPRRLA